MNNLLNFNDYRKEIRLVEHSRFQRKLDKINEGFLARKWGKRKASKLVDKVLREEIELGKEFEERVKLTIEDISKACEELGGKSKKGSEFTQKVNEIIEEIRQVSFDTLSLLGDQKIDFSGFRKSVILANVVKLGALLSPIKNGMMIRKAYDYFIGLIKQSVRRDLVMLIISFDQFQNIIMQKSMESIENAKGMHDMDRLEGELIGTYESAMREAFKGDMNSLKKFEQAQKILEKQRKEKRESMKNDPVVSMLMNSYDNTYKTAAENIKSLMNDDNQKQLEALKSGIGRLSTGDETLTVYGEILISMAEEKALKSSHTIHTNFLKLSEVFKLTNQKKLIDLISEAEKVEQKRLKKETSEAKEKFDIETKEEKLKFYEDKFKEIKSDFGSGWDKIGSKDIKKLKEETVKFTYKNEELNREKEEKISKFEIINTYLSANTDELKDCSDYLRMMIWVDDSDEDNYPYTYYSYIDILSDQIFKSLVRENHSDDECYIDIYNIDSSEGIQKIFDKFKKGEDERKKEEKILKYINDDVIKINYDTLLEKIHDLIDKIPKSKVKQVIKYMSELESKKESDEYKEYLKKKEVYDEYRVLDKKKNSPKESANKSKWIKKIDELITNNIELFKDKDCYEKKKITEKDDSGAEVTKERYVKLNPPKNPIEPPVKLRIKINSDNYSEWKKSFEEMKKYKDNNYTKSEDK